MSLFCPVCRLPTVPFGGEEICLSPSHERGYEDYDDPDRYDESAEELEDE